MCVDGVALIIYLFCAFNCDAFVVLLSTKGGLVGGILRIGLIRPVFLSDRVTGGRIDARTTTHC